MPTAGERELEPQSTQGVGVGVPMRTSYGLAGEEP